MITFDKLRNVVTDFLSDDSFFYATLIVLIALISFGLGRFSAENELISEQTASVYASNGLNERKIEQLITTSTASDLVSANELGQYVASKNSNKYHLPWCSGAKRISEQNKIWFKDKTEAETAGYVPAGNCKGI